VVGRIGGRLDLTEARLEGREAVGGPHLGGARVVGVDADPVLGLALDRDGGRVVEVHGGVVAVSHHRVRLVAAVEADAERLRDLGVAADVTG
jgi:hypothetical protein